VSSTPDASTEKTRAWVQKGFLSRTKMYFPLLYQVISRSCFRLTSAAPTIVHSVLHGCPDWPVISIYTLRCLLSTIHARGSIQFIHLSGLRSYYDHIIEADFKVSAGELASFTGQIISTGPVVGNIGRIMTRHCVLSTLCKDNWDSTFRLDDYCKEELYF